DISGTLDASVSEDGRVELAAKNSFDLRSTARIKARDAYLRSVDGQLNLATGSVIDLGDTKTPQGYLRLTASRTADNSTIKMGVLGANISGAKRIDIEAVKAYESTAADGSTTALVDGYIAASRNDITSFMAHASAIKQTLGIAANSAFHIVPGVEIWSKNNLTLNTELDLYNWRDGGEPGILTLRAEKELIFNESLSDGFAGRDIYSITASGGWKSQERIRLMDDASWSYNLVAGADFSGASRTTTAILPYDLLVKDEVIIRTGTGDIDMAASGDIKLVGEKSVVYTAGRSGGFGDLDSLYFKEDAGVKLGEAFLFNELYGAEFPIDGGDLTIRAGGNIVAQPSQQLYTEWLARV
ncbi:MAG: hypothetical protein FD130_2285, partial [Halothiobacillaceae bacterium]